MTRPEWMMALAFLATCEADAAIERGDGETANYLHALSDRAADMAGPDKDPAWGGMRRWIESRPPLASEAGCPPVPDSFAVLGI